MIDPIYYDNIAQALLCSHCASVFDCYWHYADLDGVTVETDYTPHHLHLALVAWTELMWQRPAYGCLRESRFWTPASFYFLRPLKMAF